jgi:hypothetical protein
MVTGQFMLCLLLRVSPHLTGFTHNVKVKSFSSLEKCVSVYVTVGVIDFIVVFKDVSLSTENNHAVFPSTWSQRNTNNKRPVTAYCIAFGAMVRCPTARELKAVGL